MTDSPVDPAPGGGAPVPVLVVDDQPPFRNAARMLLTLTGRFDVVGEAADGEEAVRLAAQLRPRLIVMDVRLPGITGIEATRRIVASDPDVVVVLVSTHREAELPDDLRSCGSAAFVRKEDFDAERLSDLVA